MGMHGLLDWRVFRTTASILLQCKDNDGELPRSLRLVALVARIASDKLRPKLLAFFFGGYPGIPIPLDAPDLHMDLRIVPDI